MAISGTLILSSGLCGCSLSEPQTTVIFKDKDSSSYPVAGYKIINSEISSATVAAAATEAVTEKATEL